MTMHIRFYGQLRNIPQENLGAIRELFRDFELFEQENALDFEYEGVYIDHEPYLEQIQDILGQNANGQADMIDLIEWKMFRYVISEGSVTEHKIRINDVLEKYSAE